MSENRSRRVSKKVNYAAFGGGDDDFDDDFADATPPPSKKAKTNKSYDKTQKGDQNKENQKKPSKNRKKPEERVFDKELQAALELSLQDSQEQTPSTDVSPETVNITECVIEADTHNERLQAETPPETTVEDSTHKSEILQICPAPVVPAIRTSGHPADSGDEIQVIESPVKPATAKRRAATKSVKPVIDDDGSDYGNDSESDFSENDDSDDDYDCSDDEEFKTKQTKSVKKEITKKQTVAKTKATVTKEKPAKAKPPIQKSTPVAKSKPRIVHRSTASVISPRPLGGGLPKWTPPAAAAGPKLPLGGVGITSPSSGLRIGLSRNQRLKPLHSSVKIQR